MQCLLFLGFIRPGQCENYLILYVVTVKGRDRWFPWPGRILPHEVIVHLCRRRSNLHSAVPVTTVSTDLFWKQLGLAAMRVAGVHCAVVICVARVNTNSHAEVASTGLQ